MAAKKRKRKKKADPEREPSAAGGATQADSKRRKGKGKTGKGKGSKRPAASKERAKAKSRTGREGKGETDRERPGTGEVESPPTSEPEDGPATEVEGRDAGVGADPAPGGVTEVGDLEGALGDNPSPPEATEVEDLDAGPDEDFASAEAIQALIAEATAAEEGRPEQPLDGDEPVPIVLDDEPDDPEGSPGDRQKEASGSGSVETDIEADIEADVEADVGEEEGPREEVEAVRPDTAGAVEVLDVGAPEPGVGASAGRRERTSRVSSPGDTPSDQDGGAAVDLGPVSTPEHRDRLLAQALAHAELQDARYRVPYTDTRRRGRWKGLAATVLFLIAGTVAVAPPDWVLPVPPARMTAAERARSLREALLLQAQQIEAFRVQFQRLPDDLDQLQHQFGGIRYVSSGNRAYQLIAYEADGNAIVYDSANPAPEFASLGATWIWRQDDS